MKSHLKSKQKAMIVRDVSLHTDSFSLQNRRPTADNFFQKKKILDEPKPHDALKMINVIGMSTDQSSGMAMQLNADRYQEGYAAGKKEAYEAAKAELENEAHLRQAEQQVENDALNQLSFAEAKKSGFEQGQLDARVELESLTATTQNELKSRLEQLHRLIESAPQHMARHLQSVEDELVALCFSAVCRILGEHATKPENIRAMVVNLLHEHDISTSVIAYLHPQDFAAINEVQNFSGGSIDESAAQQFKDRVVWKSDSRVKMGGVILKSTDVNLDARLEVQLKALQSQFLKIRDESSKELLRMQAAAPRAASKPPAPEVPVAAATLSIASKSQTAIPAEPAKPKMFAHIGKAGPGQA